MKQCVIPDSFIPGKPKNINLLLFPGLHHVCALQNEGLCIWDTFQNQNFTSKLFLALNTADGLADCTLPTYSARNSWTQILECFGVRRAKLTFSFCQII